MPRALLVACLLLSADLATAATSAPPAFLSFTSLDRNGDLHISLPEFLAAGAPSVLARFQGMDTDRNLELSPAEVETARAASKERLEKLAAGTEHAYPLVPAFSELDTNGDGAVSRTEFVTAQESSLRRRFQVLDRDGDGRLQAEEYNEARRRFFQQVGQPASQDTP